MKQEGQFLQAYILPPNANPLENNNPTHILFLKQARRTMWQVQQTNEFFSFLSISNQID